MEYNVALSELVPGMEVQGYYVLRDAQIKRTSTGKPYLSAQLSDATGSVDAKLWDYNGSLDPSDNGRIVLVRAQAQDFRGAVQLTIGRFRFATEQDRDKYLCHRSRDVHRYRVRHTRIEPQQLLY